MTTTIKIIIAAFISCIGAAYLQETSPKERTRAQASLSDRASLRITPGEVAIAPIAYPPR